MDNNIEIIAKKNWNDVTKSDLEFLVYNKYCIKSQIASIFNVTKNQVSYKLKKLGIGIQRKMPSDALNQTINSTKKATIQELIFANDKMIDDGEEAGLFWGPVKITKGIFKGRIGYFDDYDGPYGIVYWGDVVSCLDARNRIKLSYLSNNITTFDLVTRLSDLDDIISKMRCDQQLEDSSLEVYETITNLYGEYVYAMGLLNKIYEDTFYLENESNKKVFLSYSSVNKDTALLLASELKRAKYKVWFDMWDIEGGNSIPDEISNGIETSDALIMLISKNYINSTFCRDEWQTFYMKYNKTKPNSIIPIIIDDSEIPTILANRRYLKITPTHDFNEVIVELKRALKKL